MLTILEQSVSDRSLRNFRSLSWKSSNQLPNTVTETSWRIRTSFRKFTFIEYLKLKHLLRKTTVFEQRCLMDAPGVFNDPLYFDALRASQSSVPLNVLLPRLQAAQRLLGRPEWSMNLYYTYDNSVTYEIEEVRYSIRKVKKYSGYVRNSSAVGSKRQSKTSRPEPESFEWTKTEEIDWYQFLTVGELYSGMPGNVIFTLMRTKSSKRNPKEKNS